MPLDFFFHGKMLRFTLGITHDLLVSLYFLKRQLTNTVPGSSAECEPAERISRLWRIKPLRSKLQGILVELRQTLHVEDIHYHRRIPLQSQTGYFCKSLRNYVNSKLLLFEIFNRPYLICDIS